MRILAICDSRYVKATWRVVGRSEARVYASPPLFAPDVEPKLLEGYDVIYLDVHGESGGGYLYSYAGKSPLATLSFQTVQEARLDGVVVVATTCYLPSTPFVKAFLAAGASAVIGGPGPNWGTKRRLSGAQVLARRIIEELRAGIAPDEALRRSKKALRSSLRMFFDRKATVDALGFEVFAL